jgi:DNA polymerase-3 subunit alpha
MIRVTVLASAKNGRLHQKYRNSRLWVIITPEDVSNLVPITIAAKDADILVSQFDNSVAESALLKMDFLGLRTLTIIKDALKLVKASHGVDIDPDEIPLDDAKPISYLKKEEHWDFPV